MKALLNKIGFSFLCGFIKFFLIYYIFGLIALYAICISLGITNFIENGSLYFISIIESENIDVSNFIKTLATELFSLVPFSSFLNSILDFDIMNVAGISGELLQNFFNKQIVSASWQEYKPMFFDDVLLTALSSIVFFLFTRLKKVTNILSGLSVEIAWAIVFVLGLFASYCTANCIIVIINKLFYFYPYTLRYIAILVISVLLHALFLGISFTEKKFLFIRALIILIFDVIFSAISSIVMWIFTRHLYGIVSITNIFSSMLSFIIAAFVIAFLREILEKCEKVAINRITFPLFQLFRKIKIPF